MEKNQLYGLRPHESRALTHFLSSPPKKKINCMACGPLIWLQLQADALHGMRCVLFALHGVR